MGRTITVAVVQFDAQLGDLKANAQRMAESVRELRAGRDRLDLALFPELALSGYDAKGAFWELSGQVEDALGPLRDAARATGARIAVGLPERDAGRPGLLYNALAVIAPDAGTTVYRKVHLWQEERLYFAAGDAFQLAHCAGATMGLGICWDVAFPEWGRAVAQAGAELLVVASAWDDGSIRYWDALLRARAIENGCYVVACNRAGSDGSLVFGGHSQILAPTGDPIGFLSDAAEGTLVAELDLDAIGAARFDDLTALRDLRPDVYVKPPRE